MAIITRIRENAGWTVGIIAVALGMFVLGGDILSSSSWILGTNKQHVGKIDDSKIELPEFEREYNYLKARYKEYTGSNVDENISRDIRDQAWIKLIKKYIFQEEYKELGLTVTDEEMVDMIQGSNIEPNFANNFRDSTGQVNINFIKQYLSNIPQEQRLQFDLFEKDLKINRLETKYQNLLLLSRIVTTAEAEKEYMFRNTQANVSYFYLPYFKIADSLVDVSREDLKDYYKDHLDQYKAEPNRNIEYLYFPIEASQEDIEDLKKDLEDLKVDFEETSNDSSFININSDDFGLSFFDTLSVDKITDDLIYSDLEQGKVYGPILSNNSKSLIVYKILETLSDTVPIARAKHIFFDLTNKTEEETIELKNLTDSILSVLQEGADFDDLATQYSQNNQIDLGWRQSGKLKPEIDKALFSAGSPGLVSRLIVTSNAYHILWVTQTKRKEKFSIARMGINIVPSDATINQAYKLANNFLPEKPNYQSLQENVTKYKDETGDSSIFLIQSVVKSPNSLSINNLTGSDLRQVFHWIYGKKTNANDVSNIFDLNNAFMIVALKNKNDEKYKSFEELESSIKAILLNRAKRRYLEDDFQKKVPSVKSLALLKEKYPDGNIYENQDIQLSALNLTGLGQAAEVLGSLSQLKENDISKPLFTQQGGAVFFQVNRIEKPVEISNYQSLKNSIKAQENRGFIDLTTSLEDIITMKKELYLYY